MACAMWWWLVGWLPTRVCAPVWPRCAKQKAWASEDECELARRLLRLEYSLKGQFWREQAKKRWHEYSAAELIELHNEFFGAVVGKVEIVEFEDVRGMLRKVHGANGAALTEGQVQATFAAWAMIKAYGFVEAKATIPRATFYRHQKNLFAAGLTFADFNQGNVSALKRRSINLKNYVSGWVDMAIGIPVERELLCA